MTNGNDPIIFTRSENGEPLTKREYFAAQAMHLFRVDHEDLERVVNGVVPDYPLAAKLCVEFADALITELNK